MVQWEIPLTLYPGNAAAFPSSQERLMQSRLCFRTTTRTRTATTWPTRTWTSRPWTGSRTTAAPSPSRTRAERNTQRSSPPRNDDRDVSFCLFIPNIYRVALVVVEELLLNFYDMFCQPVGRYSSCPATQLITRTSHFNINKTYYTATCPALYITTTHRQYEIFPALPYNTPLRLVTRVVTRAIRVPIKNLASTNVTLSCGFPQNCPSDVVVLYVIWCNSRVVAPEKQIRGL